MSAARTCGARGTKLLLRGGTRLWQHSEWLQALWSIRHVRSVDLHEYTNGLRYQSRLPRNHMCKHQAFC